MTFPQSTPSVSLGLPVFNGGRYLAIALDSLLSQTYEDFELVISDNASTDETEEICRAVAARDARVRYLRNPVNRGVAFNFSRLVAETTAPYFRWAAHDDVVAPTCLERCVEALDAAPDRVCLVFPGTHVIDADGHFVRNLEPELDLQEAKPHERLRHLVRTIVLGNEFFGLIRRSALERTRLLDTFPTSDYVLLAELALLGEFREIPGPLFFRREHAEMSRRANPTAAQFAELFLPGSGKSRSGEEKFIREFWRLFGEILRSINAAPLPVGERARCDAVFVREWGWRFGARMLSELFRREFTGSWNPFASRPAEKA
jgi:glycosyltransferase involved in cell wall biosynthesis